MATGMPRRSNDLEYIAWRDRGVPTGTGMNRQSPSSLERRSFLPGPGVDSHKPEKLHCRPVVSTAPVIRGHYTGRITCAKSLDPRKGRFMSGGCAGNTCRYHGITLTNSLPNPRCVLFFGGGLRDVKNTIKIAKRGADEKADVAGRCPRHAINQTCRPLHCNGAGPFAPKQIASSRMALLRRRSW